MITLRESILERPDTYVGSCERETDQLFVPSADGKTLEFRSVSYIPVLFKIVDEIITNASDARVRNPKLTTQIKVSVDDKTGKFTVFNNGPTISVEQVRPALCCVDSSICL